MYFLLCVPSNVTLSVRQTEAAERGGAEERGTERGRPRRSAGGVRDLAGGLEARAGAARGQREEDGGGRVWEADRINGEFEFRRVLVSAAVLGSAGLAEPVRFVSSMLRVLFVLLLADQRMLLKCSRVISEMFEFSDSRRPLNGAFTAESI